MKKILKNRKFQIIAGVFLILLAIWFWPPNSTEKEYGVTFSAKYARELGLDPFNVLESVFSDLNVKKIRLVNYWDDTERTKDVYDFKDMDWQIDLAEKYDAEVIFSLGRRVPRWPECHIPIWARELEWEIQKEEIRELIAETVNRYKDREVIKYWQVENEPFLTSYVQEVCGKEIDIKFLEEEIELVRSLDSIDRPIMVTDSGELGLWSSAYKRGDVFGSTFYVYLANSQLSDFRMPLTHSFYNIKKLFNELIYGKKESFLIEISVEPWLLQPIMDTPIPIQIKKMNMDRVETIVRFSGNTNFKNQYFWGVEWWYFMKEYGLSQYWEYFKELLDK